ncbi:MAG: hypothetical protein J6C63_04965 [Lachnospiraceae bacterium]|nr:hypothetical protein [Lachnospiraceae bacterium]
MAKFRSHITKGKDARKREKIQLSVDSLELSKVNQKRMMFPYVPYIETIPRQHIYCDIKSTDIDKMTEELLFNKYYKGFEKALSKCGVKKYLYSIGTEKEQTACLIVKMKNGKVFFDIFDFERGRRHNEKMYPIIKIKSAAQDFAKRVSLDKASIPVIRDEIIKTCRTDVPLLSPMPKHFQSSNKQTVEIKIKEEA